MPPLLHIGYHKTGTTWLQQHVFSNRRLGFVSPFRKQDELPSLLIYPNPLDFDAVGARARLLPAVEAATRQGLAPVLSSERFSGYPDSGGYDSKEIAQRLATVFPEARVLIVIREQRAMILSAYKTSVRAGGGCSLAEYLHPPERGRGRLPGFDLEFFNYHRLVDCYRSLFGGENVLVLPYEQLREAGVDYVLRIASFARAAANRQAVERLPFRRRENESASAMLTGVKRWLNPHVAPRDRANPRVGLLAPLSRLVDGGLRRLEHLIPEVLERGVQKRWKAVIREAVADCYRAGNRRLSALLDLDLGRYGYEV